MSTPVLRHARHLSTSAAAAAKSGSFSTSRAKAMLKSEQDPDKALGVYSSVSAHYTSPLSSRYIQCAAVKRLAKSRRFSDIVSLIETHKSDPKITQEPFLCTLIRSYGLAGMFDHALRTYDQMAELGTPRTALSFNSLLFACVQSQLFDRIPNLFDEMPQKYGFSPDKVSYGILVKSYCELGNTELAINKLKEMGEKGIEVTTITFTTILHSLYKKGNVAKAEEVWSQMLRKGCVLDVGVYNVKLMNAKGGDPEHVKALIEEMSFSGITPNTISYNYLMTCYCRNGMLKEAMEVYKGLEKNGCRPNAATFRTMLYYLCRNGDFESGYEVFKDSVKWNKIPDFGTMKRLEEGLVNEMKREEAKEMIQTLRNKFPPNLMVSWDKVSLNHGLGSVDSQETLKEAIA